MPVLLPPVKGELISMRVLEFAPGVSPETRNEELDEVLYALDACTVVIDDVTHEIEPQSGVFIPAKKKFHFENHGTEPARFVSVLSPATTSPPPVSVVRLADQRAMPTADRWYRVLIDSEVTQFVGSIPPGRAPDHFHEYEEVLFILRGEGRMWAGERSTPIEAGTCIYLPRKQVHCVENTGTGELRLLGVFYPAGSPAVRYETATQNP
jgi:mannose-6-phosphate isomerase-like protein (cupin superfamily)